MVLVNLKVANYAQRGIGVLGTSFFVRSQQRSGWRLGEAAEVDGAGAGGAPLTSAIAILVEQRAELTIAIATVCTAPFLGAGAGVWATTPAGS